MSPMISSEVSGHHVGEWMAQPTSSDMNCDFDGQMMNASIAEEVAILQYENRWCPTATKIAD